MFLWVDGNPGFLFLTGEILEVLKREVLRFTSKISTVFSFESQV